jgi:hypothetical protein
MSRILSSLLAISMLLTASLGCGDSGAPNGDNNGSSSDGPSTAPYEFEYADRLELTKDFSITVNLREELPADKSIDDVRFVSFQCYNDEGHRPCNSERTLDVYVSGSNEVHHENTYGSNESLDFDRNDQWFINVPAHGRFEYRLEIGPTQMDEIRVGNAQANPDFNPCADEACHSQWERPEYNVAVFIVYMGE